MKYQLKKSRRKSIAIQVNQGAVIIRAPLWASKALLERVIEEKTPWIQQRLMQTEPVLSAKRFAVGELFLFFGVSVQLMLSDEYFRGVRFEDGKFILSKYFQHKARQLLEQWYRNMARGVLRERLAHYSRLHNLSYASVGMSSAKKRWGSCSERSTIRFSWRLVQLPLWVVDYVVVHELVHTKFANHGADFWGMVRTLYPQATEAKRVLHLFQHTW